MTEINEWQAEGAWGKDKEQINEWEDEWMRWGDCQNHPEEMYHVCSTKATACLFFGISSVSHPILRNEAIDLRHITFTVKAGLHALPSKLNLFQWHVVDWNEAKCSFSFLYSLQVKGKENHAVDVFKFNVIWEKNVFFKNSIL